MGRWNIIHNRSIVGYILHESHGQGMGRWGLAWPHLPVEQGGEELVLEVRPEGYAHMLANKVRNGSFYGHIQSLIVLSLCSGRP